MNTWLASSLWHDHLKSSVVTIALLRLPAYQLGICANRQIDKNHIHKTARTMNIAQQILETAKLTGEFTLRSGAKSNTYFDKYLFESDPKLLKAIAETMAKDLPEGTEILAGLEMGGIPVVTAISQVTGLPCAFVRKEPKTHGTCKYAEGPSLVGRNVVLVEDVVSSGGAILDALKMLRADGVNPAITLCVIDRETGGKEALAAEGVELRAAFTMSMIEASKA